MTSPPDEMLEDRVALVTGASSGLGAHFARVLAAAGARVVVAARRTDRLNELVASLSEAGATALATPLDVRSRESVERAVALAAAELGPIGVLINNAGVGVIKPALAHTEEDWQVTLDTDLSGAWRVAQAVARGMGDAGGGSIINIASAAGLGVHPGIPAYAAAKAGLVHLTRQLALEWAPLRVRVNCICPGHFPTELNARALEDPETASRLAERVPLGRLGRLSDLDGIVTLLASEAGAYITGAVVPVDGGQLVRSL